MTRERFEYLFEQYRTDRLLQEDWEELRQAIREGGYDSHIKQEFLLLEESDRVHETWTPELEAAMWQQIRQGSRSAIAPLEAAVDPAVPSFRPGLNRRRLVRYTAIAASITGIVVLAWWFRPLPRRTVVAATIKKPENNIHPGGNKAILTLPNGSRIILDNTPNGQIARDGSATFHKSEGTLTVSYTSNPGIKTKNNPTGSTTLLHPEGSGEAGEAFITTPRGGQFELILPDGTRVWLNSASSLRFPTAFKGKRREVELTGEGYFEITKNAKMPFLVSVNHMKIAVLGTHFNAMAYADEKTINTTLLEGIIVVSEGELVKQLQPGQQASLNSAGHQLTVGQADLQKTIAWKSGLFEFDNTDLPTIMRQLARWYDIDIIYGVKPDKSALGGSISRSLNLTEVLHLLEASGINHFKIEGKKVFVLP